jgi:hypothetical protein
MDEEQVSGKHTIDFSHSKDSRSLLLCLLPLCQFWKVSVNIGKIGPLKQNSMIP